MGFASVPRKTITSYVVPLTSGTAGPSSIDPAGGDPYVTPGAMPAPVASRNQRSLAPSSTKSPITRQAGVHVNVGVVPLETVTVTSVVHGPMFAGAVLSDEQLAPASRIKPAKKAGAAVRWAERVFMG